MCGIEGSGRAAEGFVGGRRSVASMRKKALGDGEAGSDGGDPGVDTTTAATRPKPSRTSAEVSAAAAMRAGMTRYIQPRTYAGSRRRRGSAALRESAGTRGTHQRYESRFMN